MNPRLSVLLPCRDAATTLPETIASLRAQTYDDFEVIAVDDGSTDATGELLTRWAADDPRVTVVESTAARNSDTARQAAAADKTPASRLVAALNQAAAAARAALLARMDADDVAHPDRLAAQLAFLEKYPDLAGCGAHVELFSRAEIRSGYRRYERWINAIETREDVERAALIECPLAHPTLVLKKTVFDALGGYRDMGWAEDHDLVLRILAAGARLANVPGEPLLRWRIREDRLSLTSPAYTADAFRRCRAHFLKHAFLPPERPVVVWGAGRVGKPLARELIRQGTPVAAFVDLDPRKIGQEVHGASVLAPREFAARAARADSPPDAATAFAARPYVLAAVGSRGVRDDIRAVLAQHGFAEIADYRFCA
jgi:glycosyltransferase involved in cell wall biosynthesis